MLSVRSIFFAYTCCACLVLSNAGGQDEAADEDRNATRNADRDVRRPAIHPPLSRAYKRSFDQDVVVLETVLPPTPQSDWSRIYVYSVGAVQALRAADGSIVWDEPFEQEFRPELLVATKERAVLTTEHEVFALRAEDGRRLWTVGQRPSDLNRPGTDPEDFVAIYARAYHGGDLFVLREDGRAIRVGLSTGKVLWEQELDCRPAGRLAVSDRWLIFRGEANGTHRYYVVESATGRVSRTIDAGERVFDLRVHLTPDERLLIMRSRSVRCVDPAQDSDIWQIDVDGYIIDASLAFDRKAMYLSDDARHVKKLRLNDGTVLWNSSDTFPFKVEKTRVVLGPDALLVLSESAVTALDPADGRRVWKTSPETPSPFRDHFHGDPYLVSVARPIGNRSGRYVLYFTRMSGRPDRSPRVADPIDIGTFEELPQMSLRDGAFALLAGRELIAWAHKADARP